MPAILVASKMKLGNPSKPVHSALPIPQVPVTTPGPAPPCSLKLPGSRITYSSQIPLKSSHGQASEGGGAPPKKSIPAESRVDPQKRLLREGIGRIPSQGGSFSGGKRTPFPALSATGGPGSSGRHSCRALKEKRFHPRLLQRAPSCEDQ
ncbi:hypothetical protein SKAU_G00316680 [Synaphobranchus kaupii]|uniref:Uncharacterized protein n=1 Tax=Synaphobranchus kaupii TaxID=118154 RepID=A0A9Q1ESX8_SYNKA|nr:hypothetical protein SKAU_G00316680 [Synaphobranchus kaupii]